MAALLAKPHICPALQRSGQPALREEWCALLLFLSWAARALLVAYLFGFPLKCIL